MADEVNELDVEVVEDTDFDRRAAERIREELTAALSARERVLFALAGGSTPRGAYAQLAADPGEVDWGRVVFLFGDERCVPADDPRSNVRMAHDALLDPLGIEPSQILPPRTDLEPSDAANAYGITLRGLDDDHDPEIDLVLLGMGADGHTASLFPGGPELELPDSRLVIATRSPEPPHDRLSMTLPLFADARSVLFLVRGESKAGALSEVLRGDSTLPAAQVRPSNGCLRWMIDRTLAAALEPPVA